MICMSISQKIAMLLSLKTNLNVPLASAIKSLTTRYVANRMRERCHVGSDATRFKTFSLPLRPGLSKNYGKIKVLSVMMRTDELSNTEIKWLQSHSNVTINSHYKVDNYLGIA